MTNAAHPPVILLWGEDAFLLREAALQLLGNLRATEVDAGEWQGGELQDLATPSLFGEPRALLVTDCRSLPKDALGELAAYLSAPDPDAPLVLACTTAERGKPPAALVKIVEPVGRGTAGADPAQGARTVAGPASQGRRARAHAARPLGPSSRRSARTSASSPLPSSSSPARSRASRSPPPSSTRSSAVSASRRAGTSATARSARTCPGRSGRCARSRKGATTRSWCWGRSRRGSAT